MHSRFSFAAVVALCLVISACGGGGSSGPSHPERTATKIFVNGDPRELIRDSDLNRESFFTEENISQFDDFSLTSAILFVNKHEFESAEEKEKQESKSSEELVRERTSEDAPLAHAEDYRWEKLETGWYRFSATPESYNKDSIYKNLRLQFFFSKQSGGRLALKSANIESGSRNPSKAYEIDVHHYSLHRSGQAFSLLFYNGENDSQVLFAFYFTKKSPGRFHGVNQKLAPYNLIFGSKSEVRWPNSNPLRFAICGFRSPEVIDAIRAGLDLWQEPLTNRLQIKHEVASTCPPFSDLNTQTIRATGKYQMMQTGAYAWDVAGTPDQGIIDGDIQILADLSPENFKRAKKTPSELRELITMLVAHEFGHVLGLGHQYKSDSIMNYNWDYYKKTRKMLTDYDIGAVQALYPEIQATSLVGQR